MQDHRQNKWFESLQYRYFRLYCLPEPLWILDLDNLPPLNLGKRLL